MRKPLVGTGWKMNHGIAATEAYARRLLALLREDPADGLDIFVLPPFVSLSTAAREFAGSPVAIGGQTMHWDASGAWTGEISAPMLAEIGCRFVELAHSERLQHFGETYDLVRLKVDAALQGGLEPILCLGESAEDRRMGQSDSVLREQVTTALASVTAGMLPRVVLAYEPRWAIGVAEAAPPSYVAERHAGLRETLADCWGEPAATATRIIYGGSVSPANGAELIALENVDGLFIGRAAWTPEGFAAMIRIVAEAKQEADGSF
ncbi:triose-phosphate isomerase family protein [Acidisoma sp.]|uniref:triose-phosphate isomerase family protein n=1 Tax=Acidisoma sp. TaxID=1872115 RepID=UPI003AFF8E34